MERADLTMEDWIQETCLSSAVTSGPTEPILSRKHGSIQLRVRQTVGELQSGRKSKA